MKSFFYNHIVAIALFAMLAAVGMIVAQDYGVCWDGPIQREMGMKYYSYVFEGDSSLNNYIERDHGSGFELPLIIIERITGAKDMRSIFTLRNITTHLFFLISAFVFYLLCSKLFRNKALGIIGFLALVLHPRLYTHSFFNTKDIPFLAATIIALYCLLLAYRNRSAVSYLLLGIAIGYATSIRLMSLLLILIVITLLLADIIKGITTGTGIKKAIAHSLIFITGTALTLYLCWPTLWEQPFASFADVFKDMSKFRWPGIVLFEGIFYKGTEMPWYYLPKYIAITTPLLWVATGIAGAVICLLAFVRRPAQSIYHNETRFLLTNLALFAGVLLSIIVLKSVVYDGWRHVFFIYPSFLLLALYLLQRLQKPAGKVIILIACGAQLIATALFMVNNHPYQMCYFNRLVPRSDEYIRHHYDMDYWGSTTQQGIKQLLAADTSSRIKVVSYPPPVNFNANYLPMHQRNRIELMECEDGAQYFITNFREHPQDYKFSDIIYERKMLNSTVLRVYELPGNTEENCNAIWQ